MSIFVLLILDEATYSIKKKMHKFILAGLFIFCISTGNIKAQVTIGSAEAPAAGAILDLKEEGTTRKGLGLPRVKLLHLTIPPGETSLATTIDQASGDWDKDEHIGLLIYHFPKNDVCDSYSIRPGLYVWDGKKWQNLGEKEKITPEVHTYIDSRDQEVYLYRNFGEAGDWMLENMRFFDENTMLPGIGDDGGNINTKYYAYPNADPLTPGVIPASWRPEQGLLYSYSAATLGSQDHIGTEMVDQGQDEPDEDQSLKIQGVCPDGWYIPSDRDWNLLEKELYNNPTKYSTYSSSNFVPLNWQVSWETEDQSRGSRVEDGHGKVFLSACFPVGYVSSQPAVGKSLSSNSGGFNSLYVGVSSSDTPIANYGEAAGFWTSSLAGSSAEIGAWTRLILNDGPQFVIRMANARIVLLSVRCKKK